MGPLPFRLRSDYVYCWIGTFGVNMLLGTFFHKMFLGRSCSCCHHTCPDAFKSENPPFQFNHFHSSAGFEDEVEVDHCDYPAPEHSEDQSGSRGIEVWTEMDSPRS